MTKDFISLQLYENANDMGFSGVLKFYFNFMWKKQVHFCFVFLGNSDGVNEMVVVVVVMTMVGLK